MVGESGIPIVLLHGMLGSKNYWGAAFDELGGDHLLIVPDLLGFGESPKPNTGYSAEDHADAVLALLDELRVREPVVLVGHSLGVLVALRIAVEAPDRVSTVVGFGPPLYSSPGVARQRVEATDPMGGLVVLESAVARRVCIAFHRHPGVSGRIVQLLRPHLPTAVARATADHTWESYWGTMSQVILPAEGADWLDQVASPVRFVAGDHDEVVELEYLSTLARASPNASFRIVEGADHDLPLTDPELCLREIRTATSKSR